MPTLREALKSAIAGTTLESRVLEEQARQNALDVAAAQQKRGARRTSLVEQSGEPERWSIRWKGARRRTQ